MRHSTLQNNPLRFSFYGIIYLMLHIFLHSFCNTSGYTCILQLCKAVLDCCTSSCSWDYIYFVSLCVRHSQSCHISFRTMCCNLSFPFRTSNKNIEMYNFSAFIVATNRVRICSPIFIKAQSSFPHSQQPASLPHSKLKNSAQHLTLY